MMHALIASPYMDSFLLVRPHGRFKIVLMPDSLFAV